MTEPNPSAGATPVAGGAMPPQTPPAAAGTPTDPPASGSPDDGNLGAGGHKALEAERVARRDAEARARTATEELTKLQNANLSESEKQAKRLAELEARDKGRDAERQDLLLQIAVERQAAKVGFAQPELALKLLDRSTVKFDTDGSPENVEQLLKALLKSYPNLAGGATPGADLGSGGDGAVLTRAQVQKMSPEEVNRRWSEIERSGVL